MNIPTDSHKKSVMHMELYLPQHNGLFFLVHMRRFNKQERYRQVQASEETVRAKKNYLVCIVTVRHVHTQLLCLCWFAAALSPSPNALETQTFDSLGAKIKVSALL